MYVQSHESEKNHENDITINTTYHSTDLWYSEPAEPPTAYNSPSITATPT